MLLLSLLITKANLINLFTTFSQPVHIFPRIFSWFANCKWPFNNLLLISLWLAYHLFLNIVTTPTQPEFNSKVGCDTKMTLQTTPPSPSHHRNSTEAFRSRVTTVTSITTTKKTITTTTTTKTTTIRPRTITSITFLGCDSIEIN